jgi:2,3-dihydroxybenzoate-AMP ligase
MEGFVPWPKHIAALYRSQGYWRNERLGDLLRDWAARDGARVALVSAGRRFTYAELDVRADRLAAGLHRLGVGRGDRVLVQLPNVPELVLLAIALFRIGALPVFALPSHRKFEIISLCELSGARIYVIPQRNQGLDCIAVAEEVRRACSTLEYVLVVGSPGPFLAFDSVDAEPMTFAPPNADEPAFLLLSGGTVGLPKLIPRTHDDYSCQLRLAAERMGAGEHTVYLAALPVAHNAALGCPGALGTLRLGGKVVLASSPGSAAVFPLIEAEGVNLTTLISPLAALWADAAQSSGKRFPGLLLELGGAMLDPALAQRILVSLGCRLSHWFGMAEGVHCCTWPDDDENIVTRTQGTPLSELDDLRVVDSQERAVGRGEVGELLARGPCTLRGYYRADEHNAMAFTSEGYLRTGDLVKIDPDGNLVVTGRIKSSINRGGEKFSAEELEAHLMQHPLVLRAAVAPMPDAVLGERTCAFVIPRNSSTVTLLDLKTFLAQRGVAPFKQPDRLKIVSALPETGMGKVDRTALRQAAEAAAEPAHP